MILAIYKRNSSKEKFSLVSFAPDAKTAITYSTNILKGYKEIGCNEVETTIASFGSAFDVPSTLEEAKPEKLLYN